MTLTRSAARYEPRSFRSGPRGRLRIGGPGVAAGRLGPLAALLARWPARSAGAVALRAALSGVVIVVAVWAAHDLGLNPATAGLVLQLLVLLAAAGLGIAAGVIAAVAATVAFPLLLPPTGSFRVDDPKNWVALGSFLVVSAIGSQLVARARSRADEAQARQEEVAALYRLSIDLLTAVDRPESSPRALAVALAALEADAGGLVQVDAAGEARPLAWVGPPSADALSQAVQAWRQRAPLEASAARGRDLFLPQDDPASPGRVFVARATPAGRRFADSVAALVWLTLEHQRILAEAAHLEALHESDQLKTSLLRAISHDLASPLTAVGLEVEALRRAVADNPPAQARVAALAQDLAGLRRRIENLLAMARIEAGRIRPRPEPVPVADLFRAVREHLAMVGPGRALAARVDDECPDLWVDPSLALEILVNLVDNAHRASPDGEEIVLSAGAAEGARVQLEIRDRGPGFHPAADRQDVGLASGSTPGLGLEIARAFTRASDGALTLRPLAGGGTVAALELPAAAAEGPPP